MSLSKLVKSHGLKSVTQITTLSGVSRSTLQDWMKSKPSLLLVVIKGCKVLRGVEPPLEV